jgi:hypothetical protein
MVTPEPIQVLNLKHIQVMGKTTIPTYRIEATYVRFTTRSRDTQTFAWEKKYGKPTEANAAKFRKTFNQSLIDGANKHLNSIMSGLGTIRIVHQKTGQEVVKYVPPMFECI